MERRPAADYSHIIAVTNRHSFDGAEDPEPAFLTRVREVLLLRPRALVLREKDLPSSEYRALAEKILPLCTGTALILHSFPQIAAELGLGLHLPLPLLKELATADPALLKHFHTVGTSVHSEAEARLAYMLGAGYCFAGNIFETSCKPDLPGRGTDFLRRISSAVPIPVYGIGGIDETKIPLLLKNGAAGGCMMSGLFSR